MPSRIRPTFTAKPAAARSAEAYGNAPLAHNRLGVYAGISGSLLWMGDRLRGR